MKKICLRYFKFPGTIRPGSASAQQNEIKTQVDSRLNPVSVAGSGVFTTTEAILMFKRNSQLTSFSPTLLSTG